MGCGGSKQSNKAVGGTGTKKKSGTASSSATSTSKPPPRLAPVGKENKQKNQSASANNKGAGSSKVDARSSKPTAKDQNLEEFIKDCVKQKKKLHHVSDPQQQHKVDMTKNLKVKK